MRIIMSMFMQDTDMSSGCITCSKL